MSGINVDIGAKDAGFSQTISKVNQSVKGMSDAVGKSGDQVKSSFSDMMKAGAALALGFGAIKLAANAIMGTMGEFKAALDMGGELNDMSVRTGIAVDQLAILGRAFENSGMSADQVGTSVNKLQKNIIELGDGAEEPSKAFGKLGLTFEDLKNKTPSEQLSLIGKRIMELETPAERTSAAMKIFGKSGGEMLALFAGGKDAIAEAGAQLGTMPAIMMKVAATFDTTSDNIAAIKNKMLEFAAGVLSEMAPALELITTLLSRIDAAKIGADFAKMLTGGTTAMNGFASALEAIKIGEFKMAFGIAFESIKLQAAQSANSIYANFKAAIAAAGEFIAVAFGPGSGLFTMLKSSFEMIGYVFSRSILDALKLVGNSIGAIFDGPMLSILKVVSPIAGKLIEGITKMGGVFDGAITDIDTKIGNSTTKISNSIEQIGGDFKLAAGESKRVFDYSLESAEDLIDTTQMRIGLEKSQLGLNKLQIEEAQKGLKIQEAQASLEIKAGGQRTTNAEKIKQLEEDIKSAKAQGNEEQAKQLTAQKAYYEQLERSLKAGKTMQEAMAAAGQAYNTSIENSVGNHKKVTKELKEQLTLSEQLQKKIDEAEGKAAIDPGGKLEGKAEAAIAAGDFGKAKRIRGKIATSEEDVKIRAKFGGDADFRKSLSDMAKDEGINTFGMSASEIRKALSERIKEKTKEEEGKKKAGPPAKEDPVKQSLSTLQQVVERIEKIVALIEPKLPTVALAN